MIKKIKIFPKKNLLLFLVFLLFIFSVPSVVYGATHTLTQAMGSETLTPSSFTPTVKAGDTVIIAADRTLGIALKNFHGTKELPITFTNPSNAVVTIMSGATGISPGQAFIIVDCSNIKILGNNYADAPGGYGIVIHRQNTSGPTSGIRFFCVTSWEVAYIHVLQPAIGQSGYLDTFGPLAQNSNGNPTLDPPWPCADPWDGDAAMINAGRNGDSHVHHCLFENLGGEIYLGKNEPLITGYENHNLYPSWNTLEVDHIVAIDNGADGMQFGRIDTGGWMKVHDNYVYKSGLDYIEGNETRPNPNWTYNIGINTTYNIKGPVYIYNNEVHLAGGSGIYCEWGNNIAEIRDNIITYPGQDTYYSHGFDGITLAGGTPGTPKIINNTIVGATENAIDLNSADDGLVAYNFLVQITGTPVKIGVGATQLNNIAVSTLTAAKFTDANNKDYSLQAGSPAIDAGSAAGYSSADILGILRPQPVGGRADAGAYEYTGNPSAPLAPQGLSVR